MEEPSLYERFLDHNLTPLNGGTAASWINSGGMMNFIPRPGVIVGSGGTSCHSTSRAASANVMFASVPTNQDGTNLAPCFLSRDGQ